MDLYPRRDQVRFRNFPTLVLGFEGAVLRELRQNLNVRCVISEDASADISWSALQFLRLEVPAPTFSKEQSDCLAYVRSFFLMFSDIYSRRYPYVSDPIPEVQNAFTLSFYLCYRLIKEHDIGLLVFSNIPHEGYDYIFYLIAKFLNLKIVMCYQSLIPNRFFMCSDVDDFGAFQNSPRIFDLEKSDYSLPKNWFYMGRSRRDYSYQFTTMISELIRNPRGIRVALMRHYYAARYRSNVRTLTSAPVQDEKFIYFPLHLQPELSTSALGTEYSDQLSGLERLSALVPADFWIYVKDNPKQTEMQRGPLFFKRLEALKNVRLVDRALSSIELIKASKGVAVITGTAGWEALFHGKPVLVFGRAWYAGFKGVTRYREGITFAEFFQNTPPAVDATVQSLDELMTRAGKGVVDPAYAAIVGSFDEEANAKSVCDSVVSYLKLDCS
jgi:hypothetical protein